MHLLAPTVVRAAPGEMPARVRARFGAELRRAGSFTQLGLLGAQACLDAAPGEGPLGVLWASARGARDATRAALDDSLRRREPVMPFAFIATQPHLAGAFLAQRSIPVTRTAHLHLAVDAWPWLLHLGRCWLAECAHVLVGWVEESNGEDAMHRSDWCVLQQQPVEGSVRCEATRDDAMAASASAEDWLARIVAWGAAPHATLALRGAGGTWRFSR
jgi:hypothetical protein